MTKCPFTITEICQVKLILVFWVMLSFIFFSLLPCLPVFHVLDFFLLSILLQVIREHIFLSKLRIHWTDIPIYVTSALREKKTLVSFLLLLRLRQ